MSDLQQVHATAVAIEGVGVLIRGDSGSGKSDLALRLISDGAQLIADDRVDLVQCSGALVAKSPAVIRDRLEVRGLGIISLQALDSSPLGCVIDLVALAAAERMPEPMTAEILGVTLPLFQLSAFEASAPQKVQLAVSIASGSIICSPSRSGV